MKDGFGCGIWAFPTNKTENNVYRIQMSVFVWQFAHSKINSEVGYL